METTARPRQRITFHPAFAGPAMAETKHRPNWWSDDALTADTVRHMLEYVASDASSAPVQAAADEIRDTAQGSTPADLAAATHQWMRAHVRYVEDAELAAGITKAPDETEVLIRPADLLAMNDPQGDCDDFSMSTAAILTALAIPCSIKTAKCNPLDPGQWSHVYIVADLAGGPLVLDTSHGPIPGWETSPIFKSKLWPVKTIMRNPSRSGLGDDGFAAYANDVAQFTDANQYTSTATQTASSSGTPINYGAIIGTAETAAAKILGARYGVAQMNPGQYIRNADGSILFQGSPGQSLNIPGLTNSTTSSSTLLFLGLGAVVLVVLMTAMKEK